MKLIKEPTYRGRFWRKQVVDSYAYALSGAAMVTAAEQKVTKTLPRCPDDLRLKNLIIAWKYNKKITFL